MLHFHLDSCTKNISMTTGEKDYRKACTLCEKLRDVLVRCQIDETGQWHLICPGTCWKRQSGGIVDGDGANRFYRYGGMWKNKHEAVSAKKPKSSKKRTQVAPEPSNTGDRNRGEDNMNEHVSEVEEDQNTGHIPAEGRVGIPAWREDDTKYTKNDIIMFGDEVWSCRKSHLSVAGGRPPDKAQSLWKQKGYVETPD